MGTLFKQTFSKADTRKRGQQLRMSLLSKVLLGLAGTATLSQELRKVEYPPPEEGGEEAPALRTYVTAFGNADPAMDPNNTMPVWEMEFQAHDDEEAQQLAEEDSIEALMMKDDLGQMLLQLEQVLEQRMSSLARRGGEMSEGDIESLNHLRRFKNLKAMVMSLQPSNVTIFGRYC